MATRAEEERAKVAADLEAQNAKVVALQQDADALRANAPSRELVETQARQLEEALGQVEEAVGQIENLEQQNAELRARVEQADVDGGTSVYVSFSSVSLC